jgi:hypothetical protein
LWEIWTLGDQPYPNLSLQEIFAGVMTGTLRPAVPPGCDPEWVQLMQVRPSTAFCVWHACRVHGVMLVHQAHDLASLDVMQSALAAHCSALLRLCCPRAPALLSRLQQLYDHGQRGHIQNRTCLSAACLPCLRRTAGTLCLACGPASQTSSHAWRPCCSAGRSSRSSSTSKAPAHPHPMQQRA